MADVDHLRETTEPGYPDDYLRAVGLMTLTRRASTSFLQRHLRLAFNDAARLMERAEAEGVVSRPNYVGKRNVLLCFAPKEPGNG